MEDSLLLLLEAFLIGYAANAAWTLTLFTIRYFYAKLKK